MGKPNIGSRPRFASRSLSFSWTSVEILAGVAYLLSELRPDEVQKIGPRGWIARHHGSDKQQVAHAFNLGRISVDPLLNDFRHRVPGIPGGHLVRRIRPGVGPSELSVDAVAARTREEIELGENGSQHFLVQDALEENLRPVRVDIRRRRRVRRDAVGPLEVVVVVTAASAQSERDRDGRAAAARASHALLIVEPHRRHVRHHRGEERTDVHSGLHRGGDAEQIEVVRQPELVPDRDVLEKTLPVPRDHLVGLPGHLRTVQSEYRPRLRGQPSVVVDALAGIVDADAKRSAKMRPAIAATPPLLCRCTREQVPHWK